MAVEIAPEQLSTIPLHRYSLEEYHDLIEAGGFDEDARVELVHGLLVDMSPHSPPHSLAVEWLFASFFRALDGRARVRSQLPLTLPKTLSEPEPDLAVVPLDGPEAYHPSTALLVIEVAVSSQRIDRNIKSSIYARSAIPEYWLVDLTAQRVEVRTDPTDTGYTHTRVAQPGDTLTPARLGAPAVALAELFAAATA